MFQWYNFLLNVNIASLHGSFPSLFSLHARQMGTTITYTDNLNEVMSHEDLLRRLEFMTTIVFPASEAKAKSNQRKRLRDSITILHSEFPDGSTFMTVNPIKGGSLSPRYEGSFTIVRKIKAVHISSKMALAPCLLINMRPRNSNLYMNTQTLSSRTKSRKFLALVVPQKGLGSTSPSGKIIRTTITHGNLRTTSLRGNALWTIGPITHPAMRILVRTLVIFRKRIRRRLPLTNRRTSQERIIARPKRGSTTLIAIGSLSKVNLTIMG
jgi:hypothetical protein